MELNLCFYFLQWNRVDKNQHDVPTETRAGLNGFLDSDFRTVRVQSVVGQPGLSVNVTVYRSTLQNHEYQTSPTWFAVCFLFSKFVTTGEECTFDRSLNQKLYLPPHLTLHLPWFTSKTLRHLTPQIMKVPSSFFMETEPKWWGGGLRIRRTILYVVDLWRSARPRRNSTFVSVQFYYLFLVQVVTAMLDEGHKLRRVGLPIKLFFIQQL